MPVPVLVASRANAPLKTTRKRKMNNTATSENHTTSKPIFRLRIGLLSATIWERETEEYTFYSATFEKRYRDSAGDWHTIHNYNQNDLLTLAKLADQAHTEITGLRQAN
jgi:hypothetical protein